MTSDDLVECAALVRAIRQGDLDRLQAILDFDRRAELGRIRIPTLVLCADDDILTPRYFSETFARLIPEAHNRWEPRGGHALSRTEPERFNRIALEFFTAAEPSS